MQHTPSEDGQIEIEQEITEQDNEEIVEEEYSSDEENDDQSDSSEEDGETFAAGEKLQLVRVRFPGNSRPHTFLIGKRTYAYGQQVVAMSDRGLSVGYVNSFPYEISYHSNMGKFRQINRGASEEDLILQREHIHREREADIIAKRMIEKHQLDMTLTHVEYTQNGKKAVFYFNAPNRVDFRALVKELVGELKIRVELRQISVRDRTAAIGAIGVCGLQTCCSSFLKNYGSVSIKMAKNQNLALVPTKINGVCGQIKCCMKFEDAVYVEKKKLLPKEGNIIQTANGDRGRVYRIHILIEQFEMITDQGRKRRYCVNQFDPQVIPPKDYQFPRELPFFQDETQTVIGLEEEAQKTAEDFDNGSSLFQDDEQDNNQIDNSSQYEEPEIQASSSAQTDSDQDREQKPKRRRTNRNRKNRNRPKNDGNNNGSDNS